MNYIDIKKLLLKELMDGCNAGNAPHNYYITTSKIVEAWSLTEDDANAAINRMRIEGLLDPSGMYDNRHTYNDNALQEAYELNDAGEL